MTTKHDLEIPQGSTARLVVTVVGGPDDLTGYTGWMQIREVKADLLPLDEFDESDITVDPVNRQVVVTIPAASTALYTDFSEGVYDLLLVGPGGPYRVVEGRVIINRSVTRS